MLDVPNFFHKALAVVFAKVQYLYFRRKLSVSSIEWYLFPVEVFFPNANFHWTKI